jgi:hypothetical protein
MGQPAFRRGAAAAELFFRVVLAAAADFLAFTPALSRERGHQVDHLLALRWLARRDLLAFQLGLHQIGQRRLVVVVELGSIELAHLGLDDVLGELQHLALDGHVRNIPEGLFGRAHLVVEIERRARSGPPRLWAAPARCARDETAPSCAIAAT